ncbi:hypothetical protein KJ596_01010 [Patescibacteria group bacterium]|nr:hypothetical protein [Patescibacteria group bacterium]MBU1868098.1 hypothetical protein [Patescibacteria group bacterium]
MKVTTISTTQERYNSHDCGVRLLGLLILCATVILSAGVVFAVDDDPPVTTHSYSGVEGSNGWYTSTVDVALRAFDMESGPKSTTYWLNSDPPTTKEYSTGQNQILNPSFESGGWKWENLSWVPFINNWEHSGGAGFWQSMVYHRFDWRSAAIGNLFSGGDYYYWHNRQDYVPAVAGGSYSVSAWVKTLDITGLGSWFEVWARGETEAEDQLIVASDVVNGSADWTMLEKSLIMPPGFQGLYLKLGMQDQSVAGLTFWDGISLYGGYSAFSEFTVVENGDHVLHYYSEDNSGNIEPETSAPLKIDTVSPRGWDNFSYVPGSNDHSYYVSVEVVDETSGIDVSTAVYRSYTDHQGTGWSFESGEAWDPIDSVVVVSTGLPAVDGETAKVRLTTPEIDFGDSVTVMRVQFRIADMADSSADSPMFTIEGAWAESMNGIVYSRGLINMPNSAPAGEFNSDGLVVSGGGITLFESSKSWTVENYNHELAGVPGLNEIFLAHDALKQTAVALPNNKLPASSGVYYFDGDYVLDHNSTPSGFESSELSAIIFINGNLYVKNSYTMEPSSAVLFVVDGDVGISGLVEEMWGVFLVSGIYDSNYNNKLRRQLVQNGGVTALEGIVLGRDLGRTSNPSNEDAPAELFSLPYGYFFNQEFVNLVGSQQEVDYSWREVGL